VQFDTYHGAEEIIRRVIDWKACKVRSWDGFAHPQIWIAYAQIGLNRDLYKIILVWKGNFDLRIGRSKWSLLLRIFLLDLMWEPQVNRLSSVTPRYLTSEDIGISIPWNWGGGGTDFFSVKGTYTDLSGLILILQLDDQESIRFK
jgi:hypothetical protein